MAHDVDSKEILPFLDRVATDAGATVVSYFQGDFGIQRKNTSTSGIDIVTDADRKSEEIILGALSREFPGHDILTEETVTERSGSRWLWLVDPLDGTVNFAHGFPHFCISIALSDSETLVAGIVYDPLRKERFYATRDGGSFLNGHPVHVSGSSSLRTSATPASFDAWPAASSIRAHPQASPPVLS